MKSKHRIKVDVMEEVWALRYRVLLVCEEVGSSVVLARFKSQQDAQAYAEKEADRRGIAFTLV